jgi:hypothetical protein
VRETAEPREVPGQTGFVMPPSKRATVAELRASTENARRQARFVAAQERIRKIVEGAPPLSSEQLDRLATLLREPS